MQIMLLAFPSAEHNLNAIPPFLPGYNRCIFLLFNVSNKMCEIIPIQKGMANDGKTTHATPVNEINPIMEWVYVRCLVIVP